MKLYAGAFSGDPAIVGARRADQVDGIVGSADFRLDERDIARIEDFLRIERP